MVSGLTIAFSIITLFLSLVFPIVLAILFCRKYKAPATTILLGALTFLVFQLVLRIPLIQILQPIIPGRLPNLEGWNLVLYSFYLSATAALFEEGGRAIVTGLFLKKKKDWTNAAALGIGHGGFEAISLIGLTYINNLALMVMINAGLVKPSNDSADLLSQAILQLMNTSPWLFLMAGIERVLAMTMHIGFSLLVVYGLAAKKYQYIFYSFLAHFILNFPLAFTQGLTGGPYIAMVYIAVMALLSLFWIVRISPSMFEKTNNLEQTESMQR